MPWTKEDIPRLNKHVPEDKEDQYLAVLNKDYKSCMAKGGSDKMCAAHAIALANGVIKEAAVENTHFQEGITSEDKGILTSELKDLTMTNLVATHRRLHMMGAQGNTLEGFSDGDMSWFHNAVAAELIRRAKEKGEEAPKHDSPWGSSLSDTERFEPPELSECYPGHVAKIKARSKSKKKKESESMDFEGDVVPLMEKAVKEDGTMLAKIIDPGWGASGYYSPSVLARDASSAYPAGTKMFWDHPTKTEARERPERSLKDLAAETVETAKFDPNGPNGPGVYAPAKVFSHFQKPVEELAPHIGLSHVASGKVSYGEAEGKKGPIIEQITQGHSVDFVTRPGRGGEIVQMFESARETAHSNYIPADTTTNTDNITHTWVGGDTLPAIEWGSITLEALKKNRPDLIEALRSDLKEAIYAEKSKVKEEKIMTEERIKELEEVNSKLEEDNKDLQEQVKQLEEKEILREAKSLVSEVISKAELPDITKDRLIDHLAKKPVFTEGKLDTEKYTQQINEAIDGAVKEVAEIMESGKVKGLGASDTSGSEALKESFLAQYIREGHPKDEAERLAEIAARGR